jgi:hypothetical protein
MDKTTDKNITKLNRWQIRYVSLEQLPCLTITFPQNGTTWCHNPEQLKLENCLHESWIFVSSFRTVIKTLSET